MIKKIVLKRSVVAVALTLSSSHVVFAQEVSTEPAVQKVLVTGSNIKRSEKEGSSPVQIFNAKQIAATGANTVAELLHSIPAFGSGSSVDITDGGFSRGAATASLRGLGSSSTLILLNGRRITASAYADPNQGKSAVYDLNSIPVSAIERVEVFKDGASAVYGSDAIAGVVNFITKTKYTGAELTASVSANDDGEFGRQNLSGIFGFGQDRFNGFVSFDVAKRDSTLIKNVNDVEKGMYADINGRLNPFSSSLTTSPFFYAERTPGGKNFANTYALRDLVKNRLDCPASEQITGDRALHNLSSTDTLIGRTFCNINLNDYSEVQSAGKDANVLSRATFEINSDVTAFAEAGYSRSERTYLRPPSAFRSTASTTVFMLDGAPQQFQLILPVGHPDNPFPNQRSAVGYRVSAPGGAVNTNESYRLLAGLRGTVGTWDWETGILWNRSERKEEWKGMLYRPTLEKVMTQGWTLAQVNADPTVTRDLVNRGYAQVSQVDAKASSAFGQLDGGQVGVAFGAEFRQEKIGLTPDDATQRGDIIGLANSLADGQRNVSSAFFEVRTPWTKNFEMDFAGRYDKYPQLKGNFVPKVGGKLTVNDKVAIRSTYAEGFRAPALTQVSPGGVQSFQTVTDSLRCPDGVNPVAGADRTDCAKGISSLSSATPDLRPEKSKSYSLGLILAPTKDIDVLIDYYRIKKVDETALFSAQYMIDHSSSYPTSVVRDPNPANQLVDGKGNPIPNSGPIYQVNRSYVNQGSTEVKGVDFEVAFRKSLGDMGRLTANLNWSYLISFRRAERPGEVAANTAGSAGGISDWSTSVGDNPKNRGNLSVNWTRGDHSLTTSVDFVGPVSLLRRSDNDVTYAEPYCQYGTGQPSTAYQLGGLPKFSNYISSCDVKSWTTTGVAYSYTGFKDLTLSFNVRNIFDVKAPYDPRYPTEGFNTQLHNGQGRYFRVSANYHFM
ncbi:MULTISPECIES: TonB-dependent siderophore receptor [unclassified Janthinobacterium]|uniref:TonB-dependent receptor plug domain-containing protein n=1 Tax=unclassified Janthinobacterium TaxID=2610881 RepID=UPI001614B380|nr:MULTISPECIES: TonB-dependent receptor [unclassified Janthinobacterium]MBB5370917.1 iron complex outermembrane receptor protein [Janthinobacterium sp. K2C7]MBB5383723.1 iron complex outermembrane receptor protein [Janthinobacterium sp. K2Li3]MBB5388228.1 iron complex outermembrane receptor protein [Janthinobacterium sp. K2E3]